MDVAGRLLAPGRVEPARQRPLAEVGAMGGEGGSNYASLMVEDEGPDALLLWRCRWYGRILAWRWPCGTIYIGPHWYFSIVMLGFILGVGVFHISSVKRHDRWQLAGGLLVTILSTLTFLRCALANPGVLRGPQASPAAAAEEGPPQHRPSGRRRHSKISQGGSICEECKLVQPKGCSHCEFCKVCVEGFDHHCPWMGKCIGKDNICAFYTFITVAFGSLAYIFILALLGPSSSSAHAHAAKAANLPWRSTAGEVVTTQ